MFELLEVRVIEGKIIKENENDLKGNENYFKLVVGSS